MFKGEEFSSLDPLYHMHIFASITLPASTFALLCREVEMDMGGIGHRGHYIP